ncbi:MAG: transcriptional regulator, MerR family protein [Paenibacillus sp.]|jgi:DNA-binding transcriptional MerR regulator|nr:transcriptional regulator, MerR family protein [Paenibacillus sp.]
MEKKVMGIGMVCELTGLTGRQIRYYESRQLIRPNRTRGGTRKYSFEDVELIKEIHQKLISGFNTFEIKQLESKRHKKMNM